LSELALESMTDARDTPVRATTWMRAVLAVAAVYNLAWGSWVLIDPGALFRLTDIPQPTYVQIWQLVGMIVAVFGVGYAVAATAPLRHWPIVLVGLLGKLFGALGFLAAALGGKLPWAWAWTIFTNDVVWWIPFALILAAARRAVVDSRTSSDHSRPAVSLAFRMARCQNGESLLSLSRRRPQLVVCLRHLGCTFCRESLADLARLRSEIESTGAVGELRPRRPAASCRPGPDSLSSARPGERVVSPAARAASPVARRYRHPARS
jgi:hypothetical protein